MLSFCKIILGLRLMFRDDCKNQPKLCSEEAQEGTTWMRGVRGCRTSHPFGCLVAKLFGVKDSRTWRGYVLLSEVSLWPMAQSSSRVWGGCGLSAGPRRELQAAASSARRAGHRARDGDGAGKSPPWLNSPRWENTNPKPDEEFKVFFHLQLRMCLISNT